jgi:hypothetical protein
MRRYFSNSPILFHFLVAKRALIWYRREQFAIKTLNKRSNGKAFLIYAFIVHFGGKSAEFNQSGYLT